EAGGVTRAGLARLGGHVEGAGGRRREEAGQAARAAARGDRQRRPEELAAATVRRRTGAIGVAGARHAWVQLAAVAVLPGARPVLEAAGIDQAVAAEEQRIEIGVADGCRVVGRPRPAAVEASFVVDRAHLTARARARERVVAR